MAQTPYLVTVEATSRPRKCSHETPQLRVERRLHAGSPYCSNNLVGAGPALVTFDLQQPSIATDQADDHDPSKGVDPNKQALNTIDADPPTSTVASLPATEASTSFTVSWSGQDDPGGSGIASYDIYVSDN